MSNQVMALSHADIIPTSECNFEYIDLPREYKQHIYCLDFVIETNHKVIDCNIAYLLGISHDWCTKHIGGEQNYTKMQAPRDGFHGRLNCIWGITLEQLQILWAKAKNNRADIYKPILSELILTQVLPLFNTPQLPQVKHDDSKEIQIMKHEITTFTYNEKPIAFDVADQIMVNATQMALANDKKINDFLRLQSTEDYIKELSAVTGIPVTDLVVIKQGGNDKNKQGTWVNRKIAIRVAQWASAKFAVQVDMWIEELMTKGTVSIQQPVAVKKIVNASAMRLELKAIHAMTLSDNTKQVLIANLLHANNPALPLELMLPVIVDDKLPPEEIGKKLGISPQLVGRIITELGIRGDLNYCERRQNKAKNCNKDIEQYYYNLAAIELITKKAEERKAS